MSTEKKKSVADARKIKRKPETDLVAEIEYMNDLPPVPFPPKFLFSDLKLRKLAEYNGNCSLETEYKYELLCPVDLGVTIDLIDPTNTYKKKPGAKLSPEDISLIDGTLKKRGPKNSTPIVPWLRKPQYMFNTDADTLEPRKEEVDTQDTMDVGRNMSLEDRVNIIENSFVEAYKTPTHPTNPNLQPVDIIPILPNTILSSNHYAEVVFDTLPKKKVVASEDITEEQPVGDANDKDQFVDTIIMEQSKQLNNKRDAPYYYFQPRRKRRKTDAPSAIHDYSAVRGYDKLKLKAMPGADDVYFFMFENDKVTYTPIASRIRLKSQYKEEDLDRKKLMVKFRSPPLPDSRVNEMDIIDEHQAADDFEIDDE